MQKHSQSKPEPLLELKLFPSLLPPRFPQGQHLPHQPSFFTNEKKTQSSHLGAAAPYKLPNAILVFSESTGDSWKERRNRTLTRIRLGKPMALEC